MALYAELALEWAARRAAAYAVADDALAAAATPEFRERYARPALRPVVVDDLQLSALHARFVRDAAYRQALGVDPGADLPASLGYGGASVHLRAVADSADGSGFAEAAAHEVADDASGFAVEAFFEDVEGFSVLRKQRVYEQRQEARATQEARISDEERQGARGVLGSDWVLPGGDEGAGRRDRARLR